jgi:Sulfotransferase family
MKDPIDIIYILGSGHSGSTLADLMLGSHQNIESSGEITKIAEYASKDRQRANKKYLCSCGEAFTDCHYWHEVKIYLTQQSSFQLSDYYTLKDGETYNQWNHAIISSILSVSKKRVFCDSSKSINRLLGFLQSPLFRVHILHLVRDGRAVAFSHALKQQTNQTGLNHQHGNPFYHSIREWNQINLSAHHQFSQYPNYYLLKYEDLVNNPAASLSGFLQQLGLDFEAEQLQFYRLAHHNIAGNRMRMQSEQTIKRDIRYLHQLSLPQWWISTALALPGLQCFNYPIAREKA